MDDPLCWLRPLAKTRRDALRWACVLEATAPKPGNVHPGRSLANLTYHHFVQAAEITAECLDQPGRVTQGMLDAIRRTAATCGTNVNLGIVLLLGPLVAADRQMEAERHSLPSMQAWRSAIDSQLNAFDPADGQNVFRAIVEASAGGLGRVETMDVHQPHATIDLIEAMKLAADRDRVARQYATGFSDVIDVVVPVLRESMRRTGDVLHGICHAHLRLLAWEPDSLIARKNGPEVADRVRSFARSLDADDPTSLQRFDALLSDPDRRLNPGTTADLICAGLYLLLRTSPGIPPNAWAR